MYNKIFAGTVVSFNIQLFNGCLSKREDEIKYKILVASNSIQNFNSLWVLQFIKKEYLVLNSPHGSLQETASISAGIAQTSLENLGNSFGNTNCNFWILNLI